MKNKGFSLLELLIVVIIVGVLATLFLPNFRPSRESALNDEARANLKLIQAAEKIYKLEYNVYFPAPEPLSNSNETDINYYLKLALPTQASKWDYVINTTGSIFDAVAIRVSPPTGYGRSWSINNTAPEPGCNSTGVACR